MKRRYHLTPAADILQDPPRRGSCSVYDGHGMAAFISHLIPCTFSGLVAGPQLTTYFFDLHNPFDAAKLGKLPAAMRAALHAPVTIDTATCRASFAVQIQNPDAGTVYFKDALCTQAMNAGGGLTALLGVDTANNPACIDLAKMPHTLLAGASGSGKSVMLNTMITSLLYKHTPADLRMIMIDPKQVELTQFDRIPHLIHPVVTDPADAVRALGDAVQEMERRYKIMHRRRLRSADGIFPRLLIVVDELADLMTLSKKAAEEAITRIAYKGRAAGLHLLIATQRPTVNVISGAIKANIPCRICLKVASARDSMNILDRKGGESLFGQGDALLQLPDRPDPIRIQGAWTSPADIRATVNYWHK